MGGAGRRLAGLMLVLAGLFVSACGGGSRQGSTGSSQLLSAKAGELGGFQLCVGTGAPNTNDPNTSGGGSSNADWPTGGSGFDPSLEESLLTSGRGYFTAWPNGANDASGTWPNAAQVDFLFFNSTGAAQTAVSGPISSFANNSGGATEAVVRGNLVMLFARTPTANQLSYINSCLSEAKQAPLGAFIKLVTSGSQAAATNAAIQKLPPSVRARVLNLVNAGWKYTGGEVHSDLLDRCSFTGLMIPGDWSVSNAKASESVEIALLSSSRTAPNRALAHFKVNDTDEVQQAGPFVYAASNTSGPNINASPPGVPKPTIQIASVVSSAEQGAPSPTPAEMKGPCARYVPQG